MNTKKLKYIADKIFIAFDEDNPDARKGIYLSAKTNLILAFDDYINKQDIQKAALDIGVEITLEEGIYLQKIINQGIEKYLSDNIKTIALN